MGVGEAEDERCLVGMGGVGIAVGVVAVGQQQKTGEVAFVGLDPLRQNFEPVAFGGQPAADGGMSREVLCGDLGCPPCRPVRRP